MDKKFITMLTYSSENPNIKNDPEPGRRWINKETGDYFIFTGKKWRKFAFKEDLIIDKGVQVSDY